MAVNSLLMVGSLVLGAACSSTADSRTSQAPVAKDSLYARLGGIETLRVLVDQWILQASSDERIRDYFAHSDMAILKERLLERICLLVEGPCIYKGRDLYEAHEHLRLEDRHLTAFLDDLEPAIERADIAAEPAKELRELVRGLASELAIAVGD